MALSPVEKFFHKIVRDGDLEQLKKMLNSKDHNDEQLKKMVNSKDQEILQTTPLHKAARNGGGLEMVKILIQMGADIEAKDDNEANPFHYSVFYGKIHVAEYLIKKGADVHALVRNGKTPLHCAATREGCIEIVKILLQNGADIEAITNSKHVLPGSTPLMACAEKNHYECFE